MSTLEQRVDVLGPWSLQTSKSFWEGFTPAGMSADASDSALRTTFHADGDWHRVDVSVTQRDDRAHLRLEGTGDLETAAQQVCRFLSLDVDARAWPDVGTRDPVIGDARQRLPGLRPCGFHSPYEAAAWSILSHRIRIVQAARLRADLVARHGEGGAFPAPATVRGLALDLPGRKTEYLHAVADAALDGHLNGARLRQMDVEDAISTVQEVKGLGPFSAELVIVRGANAPDALPTHERRLEAEVAERYGPDRSLTDVSDAWRPFRTWAAVHLRTLREQRTQEISGGGNPR